MQITIIVFYCTNHNYSGISDTSHVLYRSFGSISIEANYSLIIDSMVHDTGSEHLPRIECCEIGLAAGVAHFTLKMTTWSKSCCVVLCCLCSSLKSVYSLSNSHTLLYTLYNTSERQVHSHTLHWAPCYR